MKAFLVLLIGMFLSVSAFAADSKFGYIDIQRAIQATKAGQKAKSELENEFKKKEKDLKEKEKDIKTMRDDFEKKNAVLSDEVKGKKQMEIQEQMLKFQKQATESQMELQKRERDLTSPILDKMKKAIEKVANEEGLSMVFENAVWAKKELDITDRVVKEFEKM
jgi:outer membrane protein